MTVRKKNSPSPHKKTENMKQPHFLTSAEGLLSPLHVISGATSYFDHIIRDCGSTSAAKQRVDTGLRQKRSQMG